MKGNQFWKRRTKHGKDKLFETPDILRQACFDYFEDCDKHPIGKTKIPRPYTLQGMYTFLGIVQRTWYNYKERPEYAEVTEEIENIIFNQKFVYASIGLFNASIIQRDLGLVDKKDYSLFPKTQKDYSALSKEELQLFYELQKKIDNGQSATTTAIQAPRLQIHNGTEWSEPPETGTSTESANG